ncbi:hypothetical protein SAMN02745136_04351 [Anaerocolumna jejuensis DSM 15929]|uniref:Phage integrase family protein n=2 Tax=Anaerocolumna TaxID=1843210 RepID=A0A1M6YQ33_9FIRM|nr:hypothetical protein SAMN02745136_04351 [Anaerocolumna jejuensis DSM 15929]
MKHFSKDENMLRAVCLAAFGTLRRSEICALTTDDVRGNTISISKAMARFSNKEWIIKTTKTISSTREVIMHALNVPDQYIMQRGGWSSDKTLKEVYRGTINDYEQKYLDVTIKHFESMQHEI